MAVVPPVAIVITSEPENVIEVFESASPKIESTPKVPTSVMLFSLKLTVPVTSKLPPIATFPINSVAVPPVAICITIVSASFLIVTSLVEP